MGAALNAALSINKGSRGKHLSALIPNHIHSIQLVKGTPFYGYHVGQHYYLRIAYLRPSHRWSLLKILGDIAVMERRWDVFEGHLGFELQFLCDFGLGGCGWLDIKDGRFRKFPGQYSVDCFLAHDKLLTKFAFLVPSIRRNFRSPASRYTSTPSYLEQSDHPISPSLSCAHPACSVFSVNPRIGHPRLGYPKSSSRSKSSFTSRLHRTPVGFTQLRETRRLSRRIMGRREKTETRGRQEHPTGAQAEPRGSAWI